MVTSLAPRTSAGFESQVVHQNKKGLGMQCSKCSRGSCHLVPVRAYVFDPEGGTNHIYEDQNWCVNCLVMEAIATKFKGKRPSDPDEMFYPHTNVC